MTRFEHWSIIGDGLVSVSALVPDTDPLTAREVLRLCRSESAVVSIFDALTGVFIGMAYASMYRPDLDMVPYGRRHGDDAIVFQY